MKPTAAGTVTTGPHMAPSRPTLSPAVVEMTPKTAPDHAAEGASGRPCLANTTQPSVKKRTEMITAPSSIQSQLSQTHETDTGTRR